MRWKNELTKLLNIEYPIIQAPMLGVTTPEMVAAVSNEGGLGSLPIGGLPAGKVSELVQKTKQLTNRPFAVNFFANSNAEPEATDTTAMQDFLVQFCSTNGIPVSADIFGMARFSHYQEQIGVLLDAQVPVLSFTFGIPDSATIKACKEKGVKLLGTATCVQEALVLKSQGIDAVVAQGMEAGGHRGTFIEQEPLPLIGLFPLITQITTQVKLPVIAAGGIVNSKTLQAACTLGAQAVQPGTLFIACAESAAAPAYKTALQQAKETDSILTRAFTGRWARGIRNQLATEIESAGISIPAYPVQAYLLHHVRAYAQENNNKDLMSLWAGQAASYAEALPAAAIFKKLVAEAKAV